jgi:RNA polymerase sigma factor (sigma-70 family)
MVEDYCNEIRTTNKGQELSDISEVAEFYTSTQTKLYRYLRPCCGNRQDAEELVEDTIFNFNRAYGQKLFKGLDAISASKLIWTIAKNVLRDDLRARRRKGIEEVDFDVFEPSLPEQIGSIGPEDECLVNESTRTFIVDLKRDFPREEIQLISLLRLKYSAREIAELLGGNPKTVANRCSAIKNKLYRWLNARLEKSDNSDRRHLVVR